jgi:hypothetical protein
MALEEVAIIVGQPLPAAARVEVVAERRNTGTACRAANWANWTRRSIKKGLEPTKIASGRSLTSVANAASTSRLVLALRTWICNPMARAAASTPLNVESDFRLFHQ